MSAALLPQKSWSQPCHGLLVSHYLSMDLIWLQNNIYTKNWRSPTDVSAWLPQRDRPTPYVCGAPVSKSLRQPYNGPLVSFCLYLDFKIIPDIRSIFYSSGSQIGDTCEHEIRFLSPGQKPTDIIDYEIYSLFLWLKQIGDTCEHELHFLLFRLSGLHRRQLCKYSYISPLSKSLSANTTCRLWLLLLPGDSAQS